MDANFAQILRQTPAWALYERVAPDPAAFDGVVAKAVELLHHDYDWTPELEGLQPRTLLLFADADSIRPDHQREMAAAIGIGHRDASWDGSHRPKNQLAVLPGATHYDVLASPLFVPAVQAFLQ
jgi:hypothetical protein